MDAARRQETWIASGRIVAPEGTRAAALHVRGGVIVGEAASAPRGARVIDASGLWLVPAVIDTHVHLAVAGDIAEVARAQVANGVAAVLDLGMPERLLPSLDGAAPLRVRFAGPLCTAPGGYPTRTWGKDGYGLTLASVADARAAVARLRRAGATVLKLALDARDALLDPAVARAASDAAREAGMQVAAHALDAATVRRALDAGAEILAHTPAEALPEALVREVGQRRMVVLSTLHAFGGGPSLLENVRRLRAAGARVLYGTDLGNTGTAPGISEAELTLLGAAGLSGAEVVAAATWEAAAFLGEPLLGRLEPGRAASLLALPGDPVADPGLLARPAWTMIDGEWRQGRQG